MFRTNSETSSSSVPVTAVGPGVFWSSRAVSEHQKGCGFGNCRIMGVSTMFGWYSPSHLNIDTDIVGLSNLTNKCNKSKHVFSRCWIQPLVSNVLSTGLKGISRLRRVWKRRVQSSACTGAVCNRVWNVWDESQHTQESEAMVLCQKKSGMVSLGRRWEASLIKGVQVSYSWVMSNGVQVGLADWCGISCNVSIVLDCHSEEGAELKGKAFNLPVPLHHNPYRWLWNLGNGCLQEFPL